MVAVCFSDVLTQLSIAAGWKGVGCLQPAKKVLVRGAPPFVMWQVLSLSVYGQTSDAVWVPTVLVRSRRKCDGEPRSKLHSLVSVHLHVHS